MTTALTATACLGADDRAVARVHRYTPSPTMARLGITEEYDFAALRIGGLTALRIGPLTLQWDDPDHAEAFLLGALESLRVERERYAKAGGAA